jgi:hypothetical protein
MTCEGCGRPTESEPEDERPLGALWLCFGCRMGATLADMAAEGDEGARAIIGTDSDTRTDQDVGSGGAEHV